MTTRRRLLRAIGGGSLIGIAGCSGVLGGSAADRQPGAREITDGFGREVAVPASVERVVGVGPGALRQLAYLGATDRVVGVEDMDESMLSAPYNLASPGLREKPVIGSAGPNTGGNSEELLAVDPDVIVYYGEPSRAETIQSQTDTPVVGLEIVDFVDREARETMFGTWRLIGGILGSEDRAESIIAFARETIADLEQRAEAIPSDETKSAYVGAISYKGAHGIATTRKRFAPFRWTGVENVAGGIDTDVPSVPVSDEQLLAWDPETVFLSAGNLGRAREDTRSSPEYGSITGIETGETYSILPHANYHHNYGSILANAYFVGKTVYPDRFEDVSIPSKADKIFETLLGAPLYDELRDEYETFQRLDLE